MSDLDDELRSALLDADQMAENDSLKNQAGAGPDAAPIGASTGHERDALPAVSASSAAGEPKRNIGLLVGLLVAAGAILTLVFTSVEEAAIYSVTTDKLLAQADEFADKNVRVEGDLVPGTLTRREEPCEYRFSIQKNGKQLAVRYPACVVPDTFKDVPGMDVQVTAEGKLNSEGHFDATHIMAKCPSKYEMEQRAKKGEAAPHAMLGGSEEPLPSQE